MADFSKLILISMESGERNSSPEKSIDDRWKDLKHARQSIFYSIMSILAAEGPTDVKASRIMHDYASSFGKSTVDQSLQELKSQGFVKISGEDITVEKTVREWWDTNKDK